MACCSAIENQISIMFIPGGVRRGEVHVDPRFGLEALLDLGVLVGGVVVGCNRGSARLSGAAALAVPAQRAPAPEPGTSHPRTARPRSRAVKVQPADVDDLGLQLRVGWRTERPIRPG